MFCGVEVKDKETTLVTDRDGITDETIEILCSGIAHCVLYYHHIKDESSFATGIRLEKIKKDIWKKVIDNYYVDNALRKHTTRA
jgi:hypothetical protein